MTVFSAQRVRLAAFKHPRIVAAMLNPLEHIDRKVFAAFMTEGQLPHPTVGNLNAGKERRIASKLLSSAETLTLESR